MTESIWVQIDITSNEDLVYYEVVDGEEVESKADPEKRALFNSRIEKVIKQVFLDDIDRIVELLDEDEGYDYEKQHALEGIVSEFFDAEADPAAIMEEISPDIKVTVIKQNLFRGKKK